MSTNRFEAFSDGVFAIAITLLVLELSVPPRSEHDLLGAVFHQWPSFAAYLISFATVGAFWLAHTTISHYLERTDAELVRLNILLLMFVSFIPFPTRLLAEYTRSIRAERVAATLYGITLLVTASIVSLLWRYAVRAELVRPNMADDEVHTLTKRFSPSLAGYVAMIALSLVVPRAALIGYFAIALFLIMPFGLLRRRFRAKT
jgi:uncharacterized membrane protein